MQEMRQRLQVLEEQVKLNSRTSSKPPSSDSPGGRGSRPAKPKSGRKVGAQPGHKGSFRAMLPSDQVDQQVLCRPEPQCACARAKWSRTKTRRFATRSSICRRSHQ